MAAPFKPGERVRFLHEKQEGVISRIISKSRVEVLVDDFLEIEADVSEVVRIDRAEQKITPSEGLKHTEQSSLLVKKAHPELIVIRKVQSDYEFYLVNPPGGQLLYTYYRKERHKFTALRGGIMEPDRELLLEVLEPKTFHEMGGIMVQHIRYADGYRGIPPQPWSGEIPVKQVVAEQKPWELPGFPVPGYSFPLAETGPEPLPIELLPPQHKDVRTEARVLPSVIDLHIEKLLPARELLGLSSAAMLHIQMEHFEKKLTDALMDEKHEIVFIHGIGDGVLKNAIHKKLETFPFVKSFRLAEPRLYGNGATLVVL